MISLISELWPIIVAIIMAVFGGGATLMVKRANRRAEEAAERARQAEEAKEEIEFRDHVRNKAFKKWEEALRQPLPKQSKDRSDFEPPRV